MAAFARRNRPSAAADIWPGFVDALASLLMVIIFLLTVFVLAQFFLSDLLAGRDEALRRLEANIAELSDMLTLERRANTELRASVARLSTQLQASAAERDRLSLRLSQAEASAERSAEEARRSREELEAALKEVEAGKETIRMRLLEIASLKSDIAALRKLRRELEERVAGLAGSLKASEKRAEELGAEAGRLRDRTKTLTAELEDQRERTQLKQKEVEQRDIRLEELFREKQAGDSEIARLSAQISALREELARISALLESSEKVAAAQKIQIANLGKRLNAALANKVAELARYRSEFFGRLRKVLGERRDVRIVGDRFVFQSEVLFPSAGASLNEAGKRQLADLARTLLEISKKIPDDVEWILRVDGHTDIRPISTRESPSNWELSLARALSVVRFLISEGVPPERLAATGFGPYQPIERGNDEISYRRNRRIELKLTQR